MKTTCNHIGKPFPLAAGTIAIPGNVFRLYLSVLSVSFQEDPSAAELSEEQQLRKQAAKGAWSIVFDKASIQQSMDKVQAYAEAFEKIQKATGISDPDEIVKTFVEAEKHNYSLFNYVNELNNEMEKLEQQIKDIRGEIEQCRGQGVRTDDQRKQIVSDLEHRLEKTDLRVQQYEHNYEKTMQTINALKAGYRAYLSAVGAIRMRRRRCWGTRESPRLI